MDWLYEWITNPATIINIVVMIFGLGTTWANLNNRLKDLEKRLTKLEDLDLDSRLERMQVDLDRIKTTLNELKRK